MKADTILEGIETIIFVTDGRGNIMKTKQLAILGLVSVVIVTGCSGKTTGKALREAADAVEEEENESTDEAKDETEEIADDLESSADGEAVEDEDIEHDPSLVSKDVKKACDEYEAFIDEYIEFCNKMADDPSNAEIIAQYTEYMNQLNDTTTAFEEMDEQHVRNYLMLASNSVC